MTSPVVWIVKQFTSPPGEPGNARHYHLGQRLVRNGFNVVIASTGSHFQGHSREAPRMRRVDGLTYVRAGPPRQGGKLRYARSMMSYARDVRRILVSLCEAGQIAQPDIVIGCTVPPSGAWAGQKLASKYNARFVYEVGDVWPDYLVDSGQLRERSVAAKLLRRLNRSLERRADIIITPLAGGGETIDSESRGESKALWVPNGTNLGQRHSVRQSGRTRIVYAGSLNPVVPVAPLIRAVAECRNAGLECEAVILGDGRARPQLEALAAEIDAPVRFLGLVDQREVAEQLTNCDLAYYALADYRTFKRYGVGGKKLAEYLGAGLPILFHCSAPIPQPQLEAVMLRSDPADSTALASQIAAYVAKEPEVRDEMSRASVQAAQEWFDWDAIGTRLSDALRQLIPRQERRVDAQEASS